MSEFDDFDLQDFLPYLLNQAAEASSLSFQHVYKSRYGMLRTDWRAVYLTLWLTIPSLESWCPLLMVQYLPVTAMLSR